MKTPASILLLLPCSATKHAPPRSRFSEPGRELPGVLVDTAEALREGRRGLAACVDWQSPECAALDYYDGALYQVSGLRATVAVAMRSGAIEVLILSGGYGAVYADERIHDYDKKMNFAYWRRHRLPAALGECIELSGVRAVYAFLPRTTAYARIVRIMDWARLGAKQGLEDAGLFHPDFPGRQGAVSKVHRILGDAVLEFIGAGLDRTLLLAKEFGGKRFVYEDFRASRA